VRVYEKVLVISDNSRFAWRVHWAACVDRVSVVYRLDVQLNNDAGE
jgi:hypothetical protein